MVSIKSKSDIEKMLEAGKIAGEALNVVEQKLHPGMTTKDIDKNVGCGGDGKEDKRRLRIAKS